MDLCAVLKSLHGSERKTILSTNDRNDNDRNEYWFAASEERVNVNHRWLGTSVARVRILVGGLVLLGAGCAVLGWGSRLRQTAANAGAQSIAGESSILPSFIPTEGRLPEPASEDAQVKARSLFAGLPLIFEPNQGQGKLDANDARAKFVTRGSGYSLFLGSEGAILSMVSHDRAMHDRAKSVVGKGRSQQLRVNSVQMKLAGANPNASLSGLNQLPGKSNYFMGNDPTKWRRGVPQFARVRYENVYRGINLVFYGNQGRLEYDFQVAPGSDPAQAELEFHGAKQLELKDGALVIQSEGGSVQLGAPRVYQEIAGRQQAVAGSFVLRGANRAGFTIGAYDHSRELIIDPTLTFATYFGGSGDEHASSVAVDGSFNIYLAGSTTSLNLPAAGVQPTLGGAQNVYIAKITPPLGSLAAVLDYVTYLGGDGTDTPVGIRVDGAGDPFVAGTTSSSNFPTTPFNAYQKVPSTPGTHVFVTKLQFDAAVLLYSSYLSGTGTDMASGMTIDASGNVFVTGTTTSQDVASGSDQFPASSLAFQSTSKAPGLAQFFVTKVNTSAQASGSIGYSTYFGGGAFNTTDPIVTGGGIAVDSNGNAYFTGSTNFLFTGCSGCDTTDFPILNAYQPCLDQPSAGTIVNPTCSTTIATTEPDAFVAKLNLSLNVSQGQQLIWSTYLGGSGTDGGAGVAVDTGAANVYVVGTTNSSDIGTSVASLNTSAAYQRCLDTAVNPPLGTACTDPATTPFPKDAFVARLNNPANTTGTATNVTLNYFSYLGGANDEAGTAIAVDSGSGALVTGWTQSTDFPIFPASNPIQSALAGTQDAFMARLNTIAVVGQTTTASWANYYGGTGIDQGTGVTLDVNQNAYFVGDTNSADLQFNKALPSTSGVNGSANNGGYDAFVTQLGTAVTLSITGVLTQGTNQTFISAGNQATFTYTVTNNGPDLATNLTFTNNLSQGTGVPLTFNSASTTSGSCGGGSTNAIVSCSLPSLQSGSTATITVVVTPTPNSSGAPATFNGGTAQVTGQGNIVLAQTSVPAQMSDFLINVSPTDQTIPAAGATASYTVTLRPFPIYASSISLSCSGLPTAATCNFTTTPVTLQVQGPGTSTLNITTVARPVVRPAASLRTRHFYAIWLALPGFTLVGLGLGGGRRRRRIVGILMLCALFGLLLLQPACSGGSNSQTPVSGTPPGIYTITVSATSGTDTKSTTVNLTVP